MQANAPVSVYKAWNSRQAHLLKQLLEEDGIEARVASNAIEFIAGEVPYQMACCPVLVHKADIDHAAVVVDQFEATLCGDEHPFRVQAEPFCYHCGEALTAEVRVCLGCQQELEWSADATSDPKPFSFGRLLLITLLVLALLVIVLPLIIG